MCRKLPFPTRTNLFYISPSTALKLIYVPTSLAAGQLISLPEDVQHRLYRVMRMGQGTMIHVFNGQGLAAVAEIADAKCRTAACQSLLPAKPPLPPRPLALGVPKRDAWEAALRQATEMGVTDIIPLKTRFSQIGKLNTERDHRHLIEAAEQSERYTLPTLHPLRTLEDYLATLSTQTLWAYERLETAAPLGTTPTAVLVGPEGGFAPEEVAVLKSHPHIQPFSLGPTILRSDTAVVAALAKL